MLKKRNIILMLVLMSLVGCRKNIEVPVPSLYEDMKIAFENKDYSQVVQLSKDSTVDFSLKTDWFYYYLGMALYNESKENTRQAIDNLKIAIGFNKDNPVYHFRIGQMYFDLADYKNAEKWLKKALLYYDNDNLPNLDFWYAITLCKLKVFDPDAFVKDNIGKESYYFDKFCEQILTGDIQEKFILDLIKSEYFENSEKILIIDTLFCNCSKNIELCNAMIKKDINEDLLAYFYTRLLFYSLDDVALCRQILGKYAIEIYDDIFILKTQDYYLSEVFNKYLCWYYMLRGNKESAVNTLRSYQVTKYKPKTYKHNQTYNTNLIKKEFKHDVEFKSIFH